MKLNRLYTSILAILLLSGLCFVACSKKKEDPKPSTNPGPTTKFDITLIHGGKDSPSKRWKNVDDATGQYEEADPTRLMTFSKGSSANGRTMGALIDVSDSVTRRGATWEFYAEKEDTIQGNKRKYTDYLRLIEIDNSAPNKFFIYGRQKLVRLTNDTLIYENADYGGFTLFVTAKK
jgi:hypothetical protein